MAYPMWSAEQEAYFDSLIQEYTPTNNYNTTNGAHGYGSLVAATPTPVADNTPDPAFLDYAIREYTPMNNNNTMNGAHVYGSTTATPQTPMAIDTSDSAFLDYAIREYTPVNNGNTMNGAHVYGSTGAVTPGAPVPVSAPSSRLQHLRDMEAARRNLLPRAPAVSATPSPRVQTPYISPVSLPSPQLPQLTYRSAVQYPMAPSRAATPQAMMQAPYPQNMMGHQGYALPYAPSGLTMSPGLLQQSFYEPELVRHAPMPSPAPAARPPVNFFPTSNAYPAMPNAPSQYTGAMSTMTHGKRNASEPLAAPKPKRPRPNDPVSQNPSPQMQLPVLGIAQKPKVKARPDAAPQSIPVSQKQPAQTQLPAPEASQRPRAKARAAGPPQSATVSQEPSLQTQLSAPESNQEPNAKPRSKIQGDSQLQGAQVPPPSLVAPDNNQEGNLGVRLLRELFHYGENGKVAHAETQHADLKMCTAFEKDGCVYVEAKYVMKSAVGYCGP